MRSATHFCGVRAALEHLVYVPGDRHVDAEARGEVVQRMRGGDASTTWPTSCSTSAGLALFREKLPEPAGCGCDATCRWR